MIKKKPDTEEYERWDDIPHDTRVAILEMADDRIFWQYLWGKLWWLKGAATLLLTFAAAFILMRDSLIDLIQGWVNTK